ncbi:MAG: hypothetical protein FWE23_05910 [Chitinivibrionia bacterium]|nr:hypothetical protein [Chitinivibrionia bacterium]
MSKHEKYNYYALDDIGFAGDQNYKWTAEDSAFVKKCIAERKTNKATYLSSRPIEQMMVAESRPVYGATTQQQAVLA